VPIHKSGGVGVKKARQLGLTSFHPAPTGFTKATMPAVNARLIALFLSFCFGVIAAGVGECNLFFPD